MNHPILFAVVSIQLLVFQFLSLRLTRALPDYLIGSHGLPEGSALAVRRFKGETGRARRLLGILLWVAAGVCTFLPSIGPSASKVGLAAISLISTALFTVGHVQDRRALRRFAAGLPEPTVRSASLAERSLGRHYPTVWEALPLALVAATLALTVWASSSPAAHGGWQLTVYPALQLAFILAGLLIALHASRSSSGLPQRARPFVGDRDAAAAVGDALQTLELRFFLAARIGVALIFGLMQAPRALAAVGREVPGWLEPSHWVVLVLLLALFAVFGIKAAGVRRKPGGRPSH